MATVNQVSWTQVQHWQTIWSGATTAQAPITEIKQVSTLVFNLTLENFVYDDFNEPDDYGETRSSMIFALSLHKNPYVTGDAHTIQYYVGGYIEKVDGTQEFFEDPIQPEEDDSLVGSIIKPEPETVYASYSYSQTSAGTYNPLFQVRLFNGEKLYITKMEINGITKGYYNGVTSMGAFPMYSIVSEVDFENSVNTTTEITKIDKTIELNTDYNLKLDFNSCGYYDFIPSASGEYFFNLPQTYEYLFPNSSSGKASPDTLFGGFVKSSEEINLNPEEIDLSYSQELEADISYKLFFARKGYYYVPEDGSFNLTYEQDYYPLTFNISRIEYKANFYLDTNNIKQLDIYYKTFALPTFEEISDNYKKEGWEFIGWTTAKNQTNDLLTPGTITQESTTDVNYYAVYKKTFTADFYSGMNNETVLNISNVLYSYINDSNKYETPINFTITTPNKDTENIDAASIQMPDDRMFDSISKWWVESTNSYYDFDTELTVNDGEKIYLVYNRRNSEGNLLSLIYRKNVGGSLEAPENYLKVVWEGDQYYKNLILDEITFTIEENPFSRTNYKFKEWNSSEDGTGISYLPNGKITISLNSELFAIWKKSGTKNLYYCRGTFETNDDYLDNLYYCKNGKWYLLKLEEW